MSAEFEEISSLVSDCVELWMEKMENLLVRLCVCLVIDFLFLLHAAIRISMASQRRG